MSKEHLAFLAAGLAFGILIGFGSYHAVSTSPELDLKAPTAAEATGPRGGQAANPAGPNAGGGAPMMAEINRLKSLLQQDPEHQQALLRLANLYHDAAMWDRAASYYERAEKLTPDDPNLLTDLGVCYRGMRQFDRALETFDRARRADPSHWQSLFNTVIVAGWDTQQYDVARTALQAMESIEPMPPELVGRLVQLKEQLEARASGQADAS